MEIIVFFDEIMQKLWLKIGVGNLMKIFFIRNAPNTIPLSLKVFPVMTVMVFPRKIMNFSCFFSPDCHCGTPYSKSPIPCTRRNTALWRPTARQLWSDGFRRLINRFGCASSMLRLRWFINRLPIFSWNFALCADLWGHGYPLQNFSCVTKRKQKVAAFLRRLIWPTAAGGSELDLFEVCWQQRLSVSVSLSAIWQQRLFNLA